VFCCFSLVKGGDLNGDMDILNTLPQEVIQYIHTFEVTYQILSLILFQIKTGVLSAETFWKEVVLAGWDGNG